MCADAESDAGLAVDAGASDDDRSAQQVARLCCVEPAFRAAPSPLNSLIAQERHLVPESLSVCALAEDPQCPPAPRYPPVHRAGLIQPDLAVRALDRSLAIRFG